jgi:hypothetical protein
VTSWAARAKLHFAQKAQGGTDETDKTPISSVLSGHTVRFLEKRDSANDAKNTVNTTPAASLDRLRAASQALDAVIAASGMVADPDRWSYPHGDAKNGEEIDAFLIRQSLFVQQGLAMKQAECLADRLVIRAREYDDRTVCLECVHLQRTGRCGNWQRAGLATRSSDAQLGGDFVILLQRCDGFAGVLPMDGRGNHG